MNLTAAELNHQNMYALQEEIDYLREAAGTLPGEAVVVMIGAGPGVMLLAVLECGRSDLWPTVVDINSTEWAEVHLARATREQPSLIPALYNRRTHWVEIMSSEVVGRRWNTERRGDINLLVVDGGHFDIQVQSDMEAWLPHVAPGGLVFFHDYDYDGTVWAGFRKRPAIEIDDLPEVKGVVDPRMGVLGWPRVWRGGCSAAFRRTIAFREVSA